MDVGAGEVDVVEFIKVVAFDTDAGDDGNVMVVAVAVDVAVEDANGVLEPEVEGIALLARTARPFPTVRRPVLQEGG